MVSNDVKVERRKPTNLLVTELQSETYKVETEKPHLVSLGGGRLSTAITLIPLKQGTCAKYHFSYFSAKLNS